jgi:sulfocyanin
MKLTPSLSTATAIVFAFTVAACGGGEQTDTQDGERQMDGQQSAEQTTQQSGQQSGGQLSMPDWMSVDEQNETVTIQLVAGQTDANTSWNYNGHHSGNATVVVPQGYEVTIEFENQDQAVAHSVGVDSQVSGYPATFDEVTPVFDGAVTSGANKMASATQPGESETITFTASEAGEYALVCYVPAHATQGMWIRFNVSADGEAGFRTRG